MHVCMYIYLSIYLSIYIYMRFTVCDAADDAKSTTPSLPSYRHLWHYLEGLPVMTAVGHVFHMRFTCTCDRRLS